MTNHNKGFLNDLDEIKLGCISIKRGERKMKADNRILEVIKVLSLVVIAISSVTIAFSLAQGVTLLEVIGDNLSGINTALFDLLNRE
ncbi:hypothetical protein [Jeotgalibacillus haloalkalitolerans]|uniref:Uncharacterized protein n=1 Tax=Jeotgalibacillus haloalkalitolerans TaxID=3104292 RepID=A0ABU5KMX2_9BACL|nr:hypothetical protein [Jeotgalibacillus sp. HH7-29]MDZ5712608.1 hypothetical protein [Jeotgalibacillus sp. HH7-29]